MQAKNGMSGNKEIQIHVNDMFHLLLLVELGKARGLKVWLKGRSRKKVYLFCSPQEAEALLRDAKPAENILYLRQLEAVAKAVTVAGETPSQGLLNMVDRLRSKLGVLAATAKMDE